MNFDISENQSMIEQMVKDFAEKEIRPNVMKWDESQEFPVELFRKAGELGLMGVLVPEEFGGAGLDTVAVVIVHEELSASDPGFALAYLAHSMLFVNNLEFNGNDEQRERILPKVCSGEWIGAMAMYASMWLTRSSSLLEEVWSTSAWESWESWESAWESCKLLLLECCSTSSLTLAPMTAPVSW